MGALTLLGISSGCPSPMAPALGPGIPFGTCLHLAHGDPACPIHHVPLQDLQQLPLSPWRGGPLRSVSWWPPPGAPPSGRWLTEFLSLQTGSLGPEHPSETLSLAPWSAWFLHQ